MRQRLYLFIASFGLGPYYAWRAVEELATFLRNLRSSPAKSIDDSRQRYEQYDDREQRAYENGGRLALWRGRIQHTNFKEIRRRYLEYLYTEVQSDRYPMRMLEVGCGNCINQVELKEHYKGNAELFGLDISGRRLAVAKQYFGERLAGVTLQEGSITERTPWPDGYFDIVFSMFCIEQIAYETRSAIAEMVRLARVKVVMIEPVFELGRLAQKLYLYNADHTRILLKSCRELGYEPSRLEVLDVHDNPVNQSSIVVLTKP